MAFGTVKVDSITTSTKTVTVDNLAALDQAANFTGTLQNGGSNVVVDSDIGTNVQAFDADTAKTDVAQSFTAAQRGQITTLTDGANISINLADSNNFTVTLAGNRTLDNPTNIVAGQTGSIFIVQDSTGSRTLAYGSYYDFAAGTAPTLTAGAANAVDRIDYVVRSSTSIHCVFTGNYS